MDRETLAAAIEEVASGLPERCRMVFYLRWRDGLRHGEIEEVMGISTNLVYVRLHRALKRMRRVLEREGSQ